MELPPLINYLENYILCSNNFYFMQVSKSLFKDILINLRPRLLTTTWKHYPASVACYKWIIKFVEQPHLSPFLHLVLPTALILVDDFVTDNRLIGISCLHHVIDNVVSYFFVFCMYFDSLSRTYHPKTNLFYYFQNLLLYYNKNETIF